MASSREKRSSRGISICSLGWTRSARRGAVCRSKRTRRSTASRRGVGSRSREPSRAVRRQRGEHAIGAHGVLEKVDATGSHELRARRAQ